MPDRMSIQPDRRPVVDGSGFSRITTADIAYVLRRNLRLIVTFLLLGLATATMYLLATRSIYTARAQVLIDTQTPQALPQRPGDAAVLIDAPQVESQIAIIRSDNLVATVVGRMGLDRDPEFLSPPPGRLAGWAGPLAGDLFGRASNSPLSPEEARRLAVVALQERLNVRRQGVSLAIDILFHSHDPDKAAQVANTLAETYVADQIATRANAARQGSEWLEDRIDQLRRHMNNAALKVQEFKARRDYRIVGKNERAGNPPSIGDATQASDPPTLEELESTAATYRRIYESFLQAHTDAVQRQSYPVSNARVITPASPPLARSHPKTALSLVVGALVGIFVGLAVAIVRQFFDRSVRTRPQIRKHIGVDCLGNLPRMALGATTIRRGRHDRTALTNFIQWMTFGLARPGRQLEHWHEVSYAPFSPFSEALGHVKLRITMNRRSKPIKTIGVTSALAGEGKSTVASNLAALYSLQGFRTLLVDVDTRNSVLSNALAPKSDYGLIDALWKEARLSDCLAPSDRGSLMMLPVGARSRAANSPELFGSERMHEVIKELSDAFDVVVFDMPPMELVKDGLALSPLLDGILVVAEWAVTPLPVLADTVDALREARAHVLGIVCTKVHERFSFRYNRQTRPYLVEMKSPSNARASSRAS